MTLERVSVSWTVGGLLAAAASGARAGAPVKSICLDSRMVERDSMFFVLAPQPEKGSAHAIEALGRGAVAIVAPSSMAAFLARRGVACVAVDDIGRTVGEVADRFHASPSRALKVIGVTGTNGKTSVTQFLAHALTELAADGARCGVLGTLGNGRYGEVRASPLTTPDCITTHAVLARLRDEGARHVAMEVSSHGLAQGRVSGVRFDTAVFTNLSRDHLDYHVSMAAYGEAKRGLFSTPGLRAAVINLDDAFGFDLLRRLPASLSVMGYGLSDAARGMGLRRITGRVLHARRDSLSLLVSAEDAEVELRVPLLGAFNASNVLAALATLTVGGWNLVSATGALASLSPVPGRMQSLGGGGGAPLVVVDYSHTPDALASAIGALRESLEGELWCVVGCGGERDRGKRPAMAAIAATTDHVILTDDNPRNEDGDRIIEDMLAGIPGACAPVIERDRVKAIREAVVGAAPRDTVLIAGKGHETYQEVRGVRRPFSDVAVVRAALRERIA